MASMVTAFARLVKTGLYAVQHMVGMKAGLLVQAQLRPIPLLMPSRIDYSKVNHK